MDDVRGADVWDADDVDVFWYVGDEDVSDDALCESCLGDTKRRMVAVRML